MGRRAGGPAASEVRVLDDIVTTTGQAFLGLTVDCARCHDHKIDPIPAEGLLRAGGLFPEHRPYQTRGPNIEVPIFGNDAATGAVARPPARSKTGELETWPN